jgi:hypothetical protein
MSPADHNIFFNSELTRFRLADDFRLAVTDFKRTVVQRSGDKSDDKASLHSASENSDNRRACPMEIRIPDESGYFSVGKTTVSKFKRQSPLTIRLAQRSRKNGGIFSVPVGNSEFFRIRHYLPCATDLSSGGRLENCKFVPSVLGDFAGKNTTGISL